MHREKFEIFNIYLKVTTPMFEFITNEGQSIEKAFVAPASGSVTSKEGFPTVVPA